MRKHNFVVAPSLKAKRGRKNSLHSIAYIFFLCQTFAPHGYLVASTVKRSALVNIRRKALLSSVGFRKRMTSCSPRSLIYWFICTSIVYIRDFVPLFRSFLDWFQSIQTRRCHCLRLKDVLMFQTSSYSAGKRTVQWILLNNILRMALDHQAVYLGDNYTLSLSLLNTCTV